MAGPFLRLNRTLLGQEPYFEEMQQDGFSYRLAMCSLGAATEVIGFLWKKLPRGMFTNVLRGL
jgi:hypothetical protein